MSGASALDAAKAATVYMAVGAYAFAYPANPPGLPRLLTDETIPVPKAVVATVDLAEAARILGGKYRVNGTDDCS